MAKLRYYTISRTVQGPEDATHINPDNTRLFYKQRDDGVWLYFDTDYSEYGWRVSAYKTQLAPHLVELIP